MSGFGTVGDAIADSADRATEHSSSLGSQVQELRTSSGKMVPDQQSGNADCLHAIQIVDASNPTQGDQAQAPRVSELSRALDANPNVSTSYDQLLSPLSVLPVEGAGSSGSTEANSYTAEKLGQMADKYGSARFAQVMEGLGSISGREFKVLGNSLAAHGGGGDFKDKLDQNLDILSKLGEPGAIERVTAFAHLMQSEGFKKNFGFSMMTPEFVDHMQSSPEERKAYIAFNQSDTRTALAYLREHRGAFEDWHKDSFQKQYQDYQEFVKTWSPGK